MEKVIFPAARKSFTLTYKVIRLPDAMINRYTKHCLFTEVEKLKGPEHADKGDVLRIHLAKNLQTKCIMVKSKTISEVQIPPLVGVITQVSIPRINKTNVVFEVKGGRLPKLGTVVFT